MIMCLLKQLFNKLKNNEVAIYSVSSINEVTSAGTACTEYHESKDYFCCVWINPWDIGEKEYFHSINL